jgi:hypothetical protein
MSAGVTFAPSSTVGELVSLVLPRSLNPTVASRLECRPVLRFPEQLRLHPALVELGFTGAIDEFNRAALPKNQSVPEPILITRDGTILAGLGRWRVALFEGKQEEVHCIEYPLTEEESLEFILTYHQTRIGWNRFVCTCLALTLEHTLQQKALDNMRAGGKYKGSANLLDLQRIDVLKAISRVALVSPRTVGNVKVILKNAHPRLIAALQNDTLTINRAIQFCKLPKAEQLAQFLRCSTNRAIGKVIRQTVPPRPEKNKANQDVLSVLDALRTKELQQPGSVLIRPGRFQQTIVLVGRDSPGWASFSKEAEAK